MKEKCKMIDRKNLNYRYIRKCLSITNVSDLNYENIEEKVPIMGFRNIIETILAIIIIGMIDVMIDIRSVYYNTTDIVSFIAIFFKSIIELFISFAIIEYNLLKNDIRKILKNLKSTEKENKNG